MQWTHNALEADLAENQRAAGRMVFRDQLMGPAGSCRPDILAINKSYKKWNPMVYEIKISKSDFLSDVKSGKWMQYLDFACGVTFAVPAGLVNKTEVPEQAGLIVRHDEVWRHAKRPTLRPFESFDLYTWIALLMSAHGTYRSAKMTPRASEFSRAAQERHKLGDEIRQFLNDQAAARYVIQQQEDRAKRRLEQAEKHAKAIIDKANEENPLVVDAVRKLLLEYGIACNRGWSIESKVREMLDGIKERFDADGRIKIAQNHIHKAALAVGCAPSERTEP